MRTAYMKLPAGFYTDQDILQFIGWLSGDIPELHAVEVPKLAASWDLFKVKFDLIPATDEKP